MTDFLKKGNQFAVWSKRLRNLNLPASKSPEFFYVLGESKGMGEGSKSPILGQTQGGHLFQCQAPGERRLACLLAGPWPRCRTAPSRTMPTCKKKQDWLEFTKKGYVRCARVDGFVLRLCFVVIKCCRCSCCQGLNIKCLPFKPANPHRATLIEPLRDRHSLPTWPMRPMKRQKPRKL